MGFPLWGFRFDGCVCAAWGAPRKGDSKGGNQGGGCGRAPCSNQNLNRTPGRVVCASLVAEQAEPPNLSERLRPAWVLLR